MALQLRPLVSRRDHLCPSLSGVGCSVVDMDGGNSEAGGADEQCAPNSRSSILGSGADDLAARSAARVVRAVGDDETLAGGPYLADAIARLHAATAALSESRRPARGPAVLRAAL